jgi:type I restriction enzyme S subunit
MSKYKRYEKYKDSGVEWIGEIPEHWIHCKLGYLLVKNDSGTWGDDYDDDGVVVLRSTEITLNGTWSIVDPARRMIPVKEYERCLLREGDLILTKSSGSEQHIGKTVIVDEDIAKMKCVFSNFMQRLRPENGKLLPKYLYYFLNVNGREQLFYLSTTTTGLKNISESTINALKIQLPTMYEQVIIANFLDQKTTEIDDLIANKEKLIELLQEKRQAIITEAVTKGLNPNVKMKDSGVEWIGEIPEHWEVRKIKYLATVNPNKSEIRHLPAELEVTFIPMEKIIATGKVDYSLTNAIENLIDGYTYFKDGDIIMAKVTPCFENGNIAIVEGLLNGIGFGTTELHVLRCHSNCYNRFLFYYLQSAIFKSKGISEMYGVAGLKRIPTDFILDYKLGIPDYYEQKQIADYLDKITFEIDELISNVKFQIQKLKEYRQSLIFEAVTGKIDVRDYVVD